MKKHFIYFGKIILFSFTIFLFANCAAKKDWDSKDCYKDCKDAKCSKNETTECKTGCFDRCYPVAAKVEKAKK